MVLGAILSTRVVAETVETLFVEQSMPQAAAIVSPLVPFSRARLLRLSSATTARLHDPTAGIARVLLNLFNDEQHTLLLERRELLEPGRMICRGRVENWPGSQVILALNQSALAGSVFIPGHGSFQIQYAGNGWQRVGQIDERQTPPCGVTASPHSLAPARLIPSNGSFTSQLLSNPSSSPAATNVVIDLLVVYSPAARQGAGGTNGINALIDVAVAEANSAYENSQVNARLRLVQTREVQYDETGDISQDLDNLEQGDSGSGSISEIRQLRAENQADLVCMITESTGGPLGLANQMNELDVNFSQSAFCVVARQFANTYYVMAHELGHNMGCQHDRDYSADGGVFSYSHAYRFAVSNITYHTVMGPQPGLPIPYFSNPDVMFLGVPIGVSEDLANSANNAGTINLTAATVASFSSLLPIAQPPQVTLLGPTNGSSFIVPAMLELSVAAEDEDGQVVDVEFFANGISIGDAQSSPFALLWTNNSVGTISIVARATDDDGWKSDSAMVTVTFVLSAPVFDAASSMRLPAGTFVARALGQDGQGFRVDGSPDLRRWTPILTNRFASEPFVFTDLDAKNYPERFYRILPWP
jgi:hypothetical protein